MQKLLVAMIFIGALGGVLYVAQYGIPDAPLTAPNNQGDGSTAPVPDVKQIQEETERYTIDVEYKLTGIPAVDTHIEAEVQKAVGAFRNDAASFDPNVSMRPYTLSGDIADMYIGPDMVSERINLYQDTGGAHGMPIVLALNYDAKTGETITLQRALALTGKTLEQVSESAMAQLTQQFEDSVFPDGVAAKPENYQTFTINAFNVTFIFQAYQAVPYAAGMPEVSFARMDE